MALIKCKECGREISSLAKACPACGAAVRPKSRSPLQKLLMLGFIGFVVYAVYDTVKRQSAQQTNTLAAPTPEHAEQIAKDSTAAIPTMSSTPSPTPSRDIVRIGEIGILRAG